MTDKLHNSIKEKKKSLYMFVYSTIFFFYAIIYFMCISTTKFTYIYFSLCSVKYPQNNRDREHEEPFTRANRA